MIDEKWHEFMHNGEYKKYQLVIDCNRPYLDNFQRGLMEKYQLHYFRTHPLADEINRQRSKINFKINI